MLYLTGRVIELSFYCLIISSLRYQWVIVDLFQLAEQLREEDPESFELLSTIKIRRGRRRLTVEEECDPSEVFKYEWDHILDSPMINLENGQIKTIRLQ